MYSFGKFIQSFILTTLLLGQRIQANAFGINLIKVPDDDISQVMCSIALLRKYFNSGENLSGSVLYMTMTSASMHLQKKLLEAIHAMDDFPWSVVIRDPRNIQSDGISRDGNAVLHEKPQCYFFVIESLEDEDLDDIFEGWKTTVNWNPLAQFVVYLASVEETDEEMTELMIEILLGFMNKKIYNVNVIGQNEENPFYYGKTVFPYHPDNNCGNRVISLETIDLCDYQGGDRKSSKDHEDSGDYDDVDDKDESGGGSDGENDDEDDGDEDGGVGEDNGGNDNDENDQNEEDISNTDGNKINGNMPNNDEGNNSDGNNQNDEESNNDGNDNDLNDRNDEESNNDSSPMQDKNHENGSNNGEPEKQDDDNGNTSKARGDKTGGNMPDNDNADDYNEDGNLDKPQAEAEDTDNNGTDENDGNRSPENEIKNNEFEDSSEMGEIKNFQGNNMRTRLKMKKNRDRHSLQSYSPKAMRVKRQATADQENNKEDSRFLFFEEIYRASFWDKFPKDLSGCPVVAAFRPWEPYIFPETVADARKKTTDYDGNSTSSEEVQYGNDFQLEPSSREVDPDIKLGGIEYKLIQTIAERLHITIDIQYENTNLYHLFQKLIDGDIEMLIGGIDEDPSMSQYVSTSIPYQQDDLTWCVAKARRSYNLFNFLASFSTTVWLTTFLYVIIASVSIRWMRHRFSANLKSLNEFGSVIFRISGILINQPIPLIVPSTPLRTAFASAFFLALIFINSYQSFLVSTLTTPKSAYQISRLEEIYQNRMLIKGSVEHVRHLNKDGEIFKYIREVFEMCYNIEKCLKEAADNENIAVAVSRQHSFYNPRIPRNRLYCFDRNENLYGYLVTMLLPKKFHLLHKINPIVQHVIESGHMQKWARDLYMRRRLTEEHDHREEKMRSLTLGQLAGTFLFAGVALCISLFVFGLECFVYRHATERRRRRRRQRRLKIVKYLHRQFLGA